MQKNPLSRIKNLFSSLQTNPEAADSSKKPEMNCQEKSKATGITEDSKIKTSGPNLAGFSSELMMFSLWSERETDKGEDAQPLMEAISSEGIIGVFDGLGGAGSVIREGENGKVFSEAYLASRVVKYAVQKFWKSQGFQNIADLNSDLKVNIDQELARINSQIPIRTPGLKGELIKKLPTTLAVVLYQAEDQTNPQEKNQCYEVISIWAGDSRCYVLHANNGLFQLSRDDLVNHSDPMENLALDAPMSNCVQFEGGYFLNQRMEILESPFVLFVSTDGCFHYLPSPMHFEEMILRTLECSNSIKEWQGSLAGEIKRETSDDASLALVAIGYPSFQYIKDAYQQRFNEIRNSYIQPIDQIQLRLASLQNEFQELEGDYISSLANGWDSYKMKYYTLYLEK